MGLVDELQKLEDLHRRGTLTDAEFQQAKAALLAPDSGSAEQPLGQHLADQLAEVRYQNELAQIDREWEIQREQFLIGDRYGRRHVPTTGMGIGAAIVGGGFGVLWTAMAIGMTNGAPEFGMFAIAKFVFPLFGVVFVLVAIGSGIYCYQRAEQYNAAYRAYQARRSGTDSDGFRDE